MSEYQLIDLPVSSGKRFSVKSRLRVGIIFLVLLITAGLASCKRFQEGPTLRISDGLRVGTLHLGQEKAKQVSETAGRDSAPFHIVDGKLISGSSSESLSDGVSILKPGLISRETLIRRLGPPVGTCTVADSEVWIYDFTLASPLSNGRGLTSRGHLHVFVEPIPFLGLYLNNFELAIDGSGLERWADNDPRLQ